MKKILLTILILILFIPFMINAEELNLEWQKSWGGNSHDEFYDILQTQDGGFIVYGYSYSTDIEGLPNKGGDDAIIVKYDKDGNMLWQKSWGGNKTDQLYGILETQDGGFIVYGYSDSTDIEGLPNKGGDDAIIVKYDKDGNMLWQNSWGGGFSEYFSDVLQTQDGGFIVSGYSYSENIEGLPNKGWADAIIVKYDKDGNLLWQKSWGGNDSDTFFDILQTQDDGFIVSGDFNSTDIEELPNKGSYDAIIVKYDKDGNLLWQKSWGGKSHDTFSDILQNQDGGFIVYGYSYSTDIEGLPNKGGDDAIIVKYDKDGNLLWQKSWGGNGSDNFYDVLQTEDGGFITYGNSSSYDIEGITNQSWFDGIIVKYDKNGNMLWQTSYGDQSENRVSSLVVGHNGNLIACIESYFIDEGEYYNGDEDVIIISYDKNGNMLWQKNWDGGNADIPKKILLTDDNGFIVIDNIIEDNTFDRNIFLLKYSIEYDLENITTDNGTSTAVQQGSKGIITPTPNEGYEVDTIMIKNKNGEVLDLEVTKLEDGTYSFELYTDVSIEVTFKEKIDNPKTGIIDIFTTLLVGLIISLSGFILVKNYNERLEV